MVYIARVFAPFGLARAPLGVLRPGLLHDVLPRLRRHVEELQRSRIVNGAVADQGRSKSYCSLGFFPHGSQSVCQRPLVLRVAK